LKVNLFDSRPSDSLSLFFLVLELLQNLSEEMLLQLLSATFRFITVRDLKSTPLSVIKRLRQIPEKYLKALASKKLQGILEVRDSFPILSLL
jgi:hypothetical protein